MQSENPHRHRWPVGVLFGHLKQVAMGAGMDSGEWPADWAMYAGNNTGLGFDLLWLAAIACAVVVLWRR
ncbi:MAG: hypothetical protein WBG32_17595 [Nodosilinea sp.]